MQQQDVSGCTEDMFVTQPVITLIPGKDRDCDTASRHTAAVKLSQDIKFY